MAVRRCISVAVLSALATMATSEREVRAAGAEPRFGGGIRGGFASSASWTQTLGPILALWADVRLLPELRVGAHLEYVRVTSASGDSAAAGGEQVQAARFGGQVEAHVAPRSIVDPFVGISFGGFHATRGGVAPFSGSGFGLALGAELGVDFRITNNVTIGPVVLIVVPLTSTKLFGSDDRRAGVASSVDERNGGGGRYYTGTDRNIPVPSVRISMEL